MTRTPLVTTMMPVDTIKIGERIGRGLGDLPSLTADFANHGYPPPIRSLCCSRA